LSLRIFLVWLLLTGSVGYSEIKISRWDQNNILTRNGQIVQLDIKAQVVNLERNQYYNSWGYNFPKDIKVFLLESTMNGRRHDAAFEDNSLRFEFSNAFNGDHLNFRFRYFLADPPEGEGYTRHEWVSIPSFAAKSLGSVKVYVPEGWVAYDPGEKLNPVSPRQLVWSGKVPFQGFQEHIRLTPESARFQVINSIQISSPDSVSKLEVNFPAYFRDSPDQVEYNGHFTNPDKVSISYLGGKAQAKFSRLSNFNVLISSETTVKVLADATFLTILVLERMFPGFRPQTENC